MVKIVATRAVTFALLTAAYAAFVYLSSVLPPEIDPQRPIIWFSGGAALLVLLTFGRQYYWGSVALGWILGHQFIRSQMNLDTEIIIGLSIALAAYVASYLLDHFKFNRAIIETRDVFLLIIAAVIMAVLTSTIAGIATGTNGLRWVFGNLAGTALIVPLVLAWQHGGRFGNREHWLHFGLCILATIALCVVAASQIVSIYPFHFLPIVVWAGLAFHVRGMAVVTFLTGASSYFLTLLFTGEAHEEAVSFVQQNVSLTGFTLLILAAMADHRKENNRLADREQRLASIVDTAEDGIVIATEAGLLESMNPAAKRMFGYTDNIAGTLVTEVLFPVGRADLHEAIERHEPIIAQRADGTQFPAQVSLARWTNLSGEVFFTKIVRDLTLTKKAAAELADREERYRAIVDTAVDGIIVINSTGVIQSFNEAADRMFGFEIGEAIGQSVTVLMGESDAAQHRTAIHRHETTGIKTVLGTGGVSVEAHRKDGTTFTAHLAIAEWFVGGERFYTGIMRDLTTQKASEEARDILAREVDHRAKNALAVVQSLVRLTRAKTVQDFIEAVTGRIDSLARAHSLLSQGNWSGVSLNQIVEDELAVAAKESDVSFAGTPVRMTPDAVQPISMLFHELATNAFKYGALRTPEGSVRVSWKAEDGKLDIHWKETGVEIIKAPESFGFGSRMMKQVVTKQLDGTIEYDWQPTGLCVTICLPQRTFSRAPSEMLTKITPTAVEPRDGDGRRVLIVEDNALISMEMEATLESKGYQIVGRAGSVEEALGYIANTQIDVAVLDVDLGGEQSFPIADALSEIGIPYAFTTGFETLTKERGYDAPVLTKPVNDATLRRTIDKLTGNDNDGE